jgi:para-aminobenzoate synthetase component 1/para-aminobenzoate synthetase
VSLHDPLEAFERLRGSGYPWLLDSALQGRGLGRYSFAGADPYAVIRARGTRVEIEWRRQPWDGAPEGRVVCQQPALEAVRTWLPSLPQTVESPIPFVGGAVGYLGYELAEQLDAHELDGRDDLRLPDLSLLLCDGLVAFDHETGRAWISALGFGPNAATAAGHAQARADAFGDLLTKPLAKKVPSGPEHVAELREWRMEGPEPARHRKSIEKILEEIESGNVYQACLTARWEADFSGDPWALYRILRRTNPAPFASYLELPEVSIASSSPERFLRADPTGNVESRPIKGTAPRGRHPEEDEKNRQQLEASAKDRAENLMIVDLVRNDLGRVCETGSVCVPRLAELEPYATVFQLVSTVRGKLRPDRDALDLIAATFPPGSMTGAPKIAAMQLLNQLEPARRGIYSGVLGYLDARGGTDLAVVIRTILVAGGRAHLHAGGGIVADSQPEAEWREALDKLRPLLLSLRQATRTTHPS